MYPELVKTSSIKFKFSVNLSKQGSRLTIWLVYITYIFMKNGDDNVGKTEQLTKLENTQSIYEYLKEKQSCSQMRIF